MVIYGLKMNAPGFPVSNSHSIFALCSEKSLKSLVLKGASESLDDSAGQVTNRAEKGLQAG